MTSKQSQVTGKGSLCDVRQWVYTPLVTKTIDDKKFSKYTYGDYTHQI